jgi:hypothetical protein
MATIVNNNKYGEGHEVILKDYSKLPTASKFAFKRYGFNAETGSIVRIKNLSQTASNSITKHQA